LDGQVLQLVLTFHWFRHVQEQPLGPSFPVTTSALP